MGLRQLQQLLHHHRDAGRDGDARGLGGHDAARPGGLLARGGVLGIFPEGGSWASLLRPARPGLAYIAEQSAAQVVPISITGAEDLIGGPKRPVRIAFHPPLAAPVITSKRTRRQALDAFGDEVMSVIAQGLPNAQRGKFSSDADAREAALAVSDFPFQSDAKRGG